MLQLKILTGRAAGTLKVARRFPFQIGRAPDVDFTLAAPGVWDHHLELTLQPADGFVLARHPNALAMINALPFQKVILRNGDVVEIGALKIQFTLSETTQCTFHWRERLTWLALAALGALQFYLIATLAK